MPTTRYQQVNAELTGRAFPQYEIGRGTYHVPKLFHVFDYHQGSTLKIGAYCSISFDVRIILGGNHRTDWVTTYPFPNVWKEAAHLPCCTTTKGDVIIGNDVWIGAGVTIQSGVSVGDGAVLAAHANIVSDVPPYAIVGGNPGKIIRMRFDENAVARLQRIEWWNWSEDRIQEMLPWMLSADISAFLDKAESNPAH